jgi:hypothetical protein
MKEKSVGAMQEKTCRGSAGAIRGAVQKKNVGAMQENCAGQSEKKRQSDARELRGAVRRNA